MNTYKAVSSLESVDFKAENMKLAVQWVENHLNCSFAWVVALTKLVIED